VTVSCRDIAGSGNNRWLRDCAIQTEAGSDGRPTPPAPQAPPPPPPPPPPTTK